MIVLLVLRRALTRAAKGNTKALAIAAVALFVFGFVSIYFAERGVNADFRTLADGIWWTLVTVSTVGYGDKVPITAAGRAIAAVCIIGGPVLLVSLIASSSVLVYDEWRRVLKGMSQVASKEHIVICGWNPKVKDTIYEIRLSKKLGKRPIIIIDDRIDEKPLDDPNVIFVSGSPADSEILKRASIQRAAFALVFADDRTSAADEKTALTVLAIKTLNPSVETCAELNDARNEPHLRRAGCNVVVNTSDLTSKLMALSTENPAINRVITELVSRTRGNEIYRVDVPLRYLDRPFEEPFQALKRSHKVIVIGVEVGEQCQINPPADFVLRKGHSLLVISEHSPTLDTQ